MSSYGAQQLASSFRTVRKNTIQIAQEIPEDKYGYAPFEGARTVAQMLTHIAITPMQLWHALHGTRTLDVTTFDFFGLGGRLQAEEKKPRTKAEIIELLTSEGEKFADFLGGLSDDFLNDQVQAYGPSGPIHKVRLEMLLSPKEHEMHHRAQLMLIERQLGIVPHLTRAMQARIEEMAKARATV